MEISFQTQKLADLFNTEKALKQEFGDQNARLIMRRLAVLAAAPCLDDVPYTPPTRRHELKGNKKGQFAVDLKHPYRLVFVTTHNPAPCKPDGGLDLRRITAVTILGVEDYH